MFTRFNFFLLLFPFFLSCNNKYKPEASNLSSSDALEQDLKIEIYDEAALSIIDPNANLEILANGFYWSEGPLWIEDLQSVIFSDVPANKIYQWNEEEGLSTYLKSAGHSGAENINSGRGPNGLILDLEERLIICQHGDRRIARLAADLRDPEPDFITVADSYQGKRFNSPNDLVMDQSGNIYFTDPPYGLPENKTGEIGMNGVFKVSPKEEVTVLVDSLSMPNGIGLSPNEKTLYINQSDPKNPVLYSYEIAGDGSLKNGKILFDFKALSEEKKGLPDGLKVHESGNIFATGPGGVHIISPQGKHLAAILTGTATANCAFDTGQEHLYMTSTDRLMRVKLK